MRPAVTVITALNDMKPEKLYTKLLVLANAYGSIGVKAQDQVS